MDALTTSAIIKAMDGLTVRMSVTAENIANAGTPGYRPLRVSFEQALASAAQQGEAAVQAVKPTIERAPQTGDSADMRLDLEAQTAASTATRYSALVDVLGREMSLDNIAITGTF